MLQFNSPVQFPANWQRTSSPAINRLFAQNIDIEQAIRYLEDELRDIGADSAVLFSNFDNIANEGKRSKKGHSEGVGLRFNLGDATIFMGCDKWASCAQNIYGLSSSLRNIRLISDAGTISLIQLLNCCNIKEKRHAYLHNSKGNSAAPDWLLLLGLGETATLSDANAVYRARAKLIHTDEDALIELNQAIEQARLHLKD
jgi:hypothetical protein